MEKKDIHHRFPFFAGALFLVLLAVIVAGAWYYYQHQEKSFRTKVQDELSAVANLKMEQIVSWRKERLADADLLSRGGLLTGKNAPKYNIRDKFRRISPMLAIYKKDFGYYSLIVTDIAGRVLENIGDTSRAPLYVDTAAILLVVAEKKTKVVDFYLCPACGRVHLDVIVPVFEGEIGSVVAGVVVLRRDPVFFLFPLIQSWPTPSRTSETLLFRREGDSIVFLNELRHKKSTALKLRFSVNEKNLPAARVALGQEGFMEGTDYRGVKVFAVGRHIADSPWYIIAKVDKEEVLAPLRAAGRSTLVIGGLGIAILLSLLVMWWMAYDRKMLLARYQEEMARKRAENQINQLNQELLQKNAELEQLVFVASHDLRSPLVNVQGFSKEMGILFNELAEITSHACLSGKPLSRLTDILTKEFPEAQNYVLASVIKMDMLLKGLLKLSRLGRAAVALQEINMDDMLSGVIKTLEFQIQHCGARMELSALPSCIGDPVQVNQVFTNLIDNAIKFLSPDRAGSIRIFGKSLNGICEYCVEDNGIGIAPQHQLKVFEIFHRLDPQMCEGEGLGLAIVKKIVLMLNGNVRLESEVGKGSKFIVTLPAA